MTFEIIKTNYDRGLWGKAQVEVAVTKGVITREQANAIYEGGPNPVGGDSSADIEKALENALDILKGVAE